MARRLCSGGADLLPLATPAIGITAVFIFIYCWNEFVLAMTLLRSPENNTLTFQVFSLVGALPDPMGSGDGGDAGRRVPVAVSSRCCSATSSAALPSAR